MVRQPGDRYWRSELVLSMGLSRLLDFGRGHPRDSPVEGSPGGGIAGWGGEGKSVSIWVNMEDPDFGEILSFLGKRVADASGTDP